MNCRYRLCFFPVGVRNKHFNGEGPIRLLFAKDVDGIPHFVLFSCSNPLSDTHRKRVRANIKPPLAPCITLHLKLPPVRR